MQSRKPEQQENQAPTQTNKKSSLATFGNFAVNVAAVAALLAVAATELVPDDYQMKNA